MKSPISILFLATAFEHIISSAEAAASTTPTLLNINPKQKPKIIFASMPGPPGEIGDTAFPETEVITTPKTTVTPATTPFSIDILTLLGLENKKIVIPDAYLSFLFPNYTPVPTPPLISSNAYKPPITAAPIYTAVPDIKYVPPTTQPPIYKPITANPVYFLWPVTEYKPPPTTAVPLYGFKTDSYTSNCADLDRECPKFRGQQQCILNPLWMNPNCPFSCGLCANCSDQDVDCVKFKNKGECWANPAYMFAFCHSSCNQCKKL